MSSMINFGAGLAAAGGAIAATAGSAALVQQKADLDQQMATLTNSLATTRETTLEAQRQTGAQTLAKQTAGYASGLETQRSEAAIALAKTSSQLSVQAQSDIAKNAASLTEQLGSDPKYLEAQKNLASADPLRMAQASEAVNQAALFALQTESGTKVANARQAIIDEQSKPGGGDQAKLAELNQNFAALLTDPAAAAALKTAAVANERVAEDSAARASTDLNVATAKLQDPNISGDPAARAALQSNVDQLTMRVKTLNKAADDARAMANGAFGMKPSADNNAAPTAPPPAPANAADRKANQPYALPNGKVGTWEGSGWKIVGGASPATGTGMINSPTQ